MICIRTMLSTYSNVHDDSGCQLSVTYRADIIDRQSRGDDGHNLVTVVMRQYGLNLQEAFDWIGDLHQDLENSFLANFKKLPHFPLESDTINRELHEYACALGNWVRANDQWSFEVRVLSLPGFYHKRLAC